LVMTACSGGSATMDQGLVISPIPPEYQGWTNPLGPDAAEAGKEVYATFCVPCHGETGHGDGPAGASLEPAPVNFYELYPLVNEDYYYFAISEGIPGTSMVAWKNTLSQEELYQVVAYIRTFK